MSKTDSFHKKYRPQFHFSPEKMWMNDPNGMVFFNGEYHLFYQYHPNDTVWGPMHWGHAVSKDLIHWKHLPIALFPDVHGMIFSGSAVVDWKDTTGFFDGKPGLVAIFTSTDGPKQRQSLAYSKDNGRTWAKYEGNPVLTDVNQLDYRDPKVFFHPETNKWVMVLATGQTITIYTSSNLIDWEFASEFGEGIGSHDGVWECPDLFKLPVDGDQNDEKWVLFVSVGDNGKSKEGSRTQYFIGDFNGKTFIADDKIVRWLDYGRDNYAGVSWSDIPAHDGRRIYIGWMNNWRYANQVPTETWRGAMTLPRELSLITDDKGFSLVQKVVSEIESIRGEGDSYANLTMEPHHPFTFELKKGLLEITIEFEKGNGTSFGLDLQGSNEEMLSIYYDVEKKTVQLDRTNAGEKSFSDSFAVVQEAALKMEKDKLHFQIFIDTSSIEVFANGGKVAFTSLLFPTKPYGKINLFSKGGDTRVTAMTLTKLDSIWIR